MMNLKNLTKRHELFFFGVDLFMLGLLVINLSLMFFNWLFESSLVRGVLQKALPTFHDAYDLYIYQNFFLIDLVFVVIFLSEFCARWAVAAYLRLHDKWFFFPFIYWYDLLGSLPGGTFRILRFFRIVAILYRWQQLEIIDISGSSLVRAVRKYYSVFVEEVSDRVVVNVLEGAKTEVRRGSPLVDRIIEEVITPNRPVMIAWLSERLGHSVGVVHERYRYQLRQYVDRVVTETMENNKQVGLLEKVPLVGGIAAETLERTVSEIVTGVIERMLEDLSGAENRLAVEEAADLAVEVLTASGQDTTTNLLFVETVNQVITLVQEQVSVKQWKIKEQEGHF